MEDVRVVSDGRAVTVYEGDRAVLTMSRREYESLRRSLLGFDLVRNCVIRPDAVVNYCEETNPHLLDTEIQIEKNRERRRARNTITNLLPWITVMSILILVAAIAFSIIHSSGGAAVHAIQHAAKAVENSTPVRLR
ncbi:MAG: hypothetical protein GXO00_00820 [Candidatus Diapherotrites archaeon]|nr:hypothetical protein [Candidatus Diapherotrites archaeon]